ncbi:MAG: type II secretion system protein GspG [Verrucomicrobiales bacterium]
MSEGYGEPKTWSVSRKSVAKTAVGFAIVAMIVGLVVSLSRPTCSYPPEIRVLGDFISIEAGLTVYEAKCRQLPTTEQGLMALFEKPTAEPIPRNWTRQVNRIPKDPWGVEYRYRKIAGSREPGRFLLTSAGPDRQFDTEDDLTNNDQ